MTRTNVAIALLVAIFAGEAVTVTLGAAGDKVGFPTNYAKGVLYWTQDRPLNKQVREYYISQAAIDAVQNDKPIPSGTVITVVQYNTKNDEAANPVKDANGRFVKADIRGFTVMEKRTGWGAEYAADVRNGEWEYQSFGADRKPNTMADLNTCFTCHKRQETSDFVYSINNIRAPGQ
jgi:hypothetical protein